MSAPGSPAGDEPAPRVDGARVAFVLYYYAPYVSGLSLYVRALAEGLVTRGASVSVITSRHERALPARELLGGVHVHRLAPLARIDKGIVLPGLLPAVRRLARTHDVIIPVMPLVEAGAIEAVARTATVLPSYVCDLRLGPGRISRAAEWLAGRSARRAVRRSNAFVALSVEFARASRVVGEMAHKAIEVVPPVDPRRFHRVDAGDLRRRLLLPEGPVIGFLGRLSREKGLPNLIRAFQAIRARHPSATLLIAGEGAALAGGGIGPELETMAQDDDRIRFTGFLADDDLSAFYSLCTVLALPSIDPLEAFGIVQVEAMLCGCPVVASDLPGVRIPVVRTGMGLNVPPGDDAALADALAAVIARPEAFTRDRELVVDAFSFERSIDQITAAVAAAR